MKKFIWLIWAVPLPAASQAFATDSPHALAQKGTAETAAAEFEYHVSPEGRR